ncbi:MAG: hypothetical protein ACR2OU_20715 [Thermomicrobiales bacterium]
MANLRLGKFASTRAWLEVDELESATSCYVVGSPDMGKSTLLGNLVEQFAARESEGLLVLDIKGDLVRAIAARTHYPDRVVYIAPGAAYAAGRLWAFNPFEYDRMDKETREQVLIDVPRVFERLGLAQLDTMFNVATTLEECARLAAASAEPTLMDLYAILFSEPYRRELLARTSFYPSLEFWSEFEQMSTHDKRALTLTARNRLRRVLRPKMMHGTLGQYRSTISLQSWLDDGKIILVDLGNPLPRQQGIDLGNLLMGQLTSLAFARPEAARNKLWRVVVDEFQLFVGKAFGEIITQARSYRVFPVMAHQGRNQLRGDDARQAAPLLGDLDHAGIKLFLATSAEDRVALAALYGLERTSGFADQPRFTATAMWRRGPRGTRKERQILLQDWWGPEIDGQQEQLQDRDLAAYTRPRRTVEQQLTARYWSRVPGLTFQHPKDAGHDHQKPARTDRQSPPAPPRQHGPPPAQTIRPRSDPDGHRDPGHARPVRAADQSPDRRLPVPGPPKPARPDSERGSGESGG